MYQIGDLVIYGSTGVCRVENITALEDKSALQGLLSNRRYYTLQPLYQSGTIYTPVDNPKIFMRHVISKEKAESLIALIPTIKAEAYHSTRTQELKEHYEAATRTHDCADLIELSMSIYAKKKYIEQQKGKFGQVDERYMKLAEDLLYGEFAAVLGIPKEDVQDYIAKKVALQGENNE